MSEQNTNERVSPPDAGDGHVDVVDGVWTAYTAEELAAHHRNRVFGWAVAGLLSLLLWAVLISAVLLILHGSGRI